MCNNKKYPLSLNGNTFNAFKSDFDQMLRKLLLEMEKWDSEEATINMKMVVTLSKDQERDFECNGYDGMKDIIKPSFKHEIGTVLQVKDKKSGSLGGNMKMVWDRENCVYVMQDIDNGQTTLFDESGDPVEQPPKHEMLQPPEGVIDAGYEPVEEGNGLYEFANTCGRCGRKTTYEMSEQELGLPRRIEKVSTRGTKKQKMNWTYGCGILP